MRCNQKLLEAARNNSVTPASGSGSENGNGSIGKGDGMSPDGKLSPALSVEENGKRKQRRYRTTFSASQLDELEKVSFVFQCPQKTKNIDDLAKKTYTLNVYH